MREMSDFSQDELTVGPDTSFPLHLYNVPLPILHAATERLGAFEISRLGWNNLVPLFVKHDIRCREIDAYVREYMPKYKEALERIPEGDEDDDGGRIEKALSVLDVLPDVEVEVLFESFDFDLQPARQLFKNVEESSIEEAVDALDRLAWKEGRVIVVKSDERGWNAFRLLADAGLALADEAIPLAERLGALKVRELAEVAQELGIRAAGQKTKLIAALADHTDTPMMLMRRRAHQVFLKAHPEGSEGARLVEMVALLIGRARLVSEMIGRTYMSALSSASRKQFDEDGFIVGWEILVIDDVRCCRHCRNAATRRYPAKQPPRVPLHLACRCTLSPVTRIETQ